MSPEPSHVVVPLEPCPATSRPAAIHCTMAVTIWHDDRCDGCMGDGQRAVLDQAVPVEHSTLRDDDDSGFDVNVECWREVES